MELSRRGLLSGLIAAPAVVAVGNIMPVRLWDPIVYWGYNVCTDEYSLYEPAAFVQRLASSKNWYGPEGWHEPNPNHVREIIKSTLHGLQKGTMRDWEKFQASRSAAHALACPEKVLAEYRAREYIRTGLASSWTS